MLDKLKKINNAYTLATVIFILTFLSILLLLTTYFVSYYLHSAARRVKPVSEWKGYYEILDEIKGKYFEKEIKDNFTSPFEGWYKDLPEELNGFKLSYFPEDSKIDINHLDASMLFGESDASGDQKDKNKEYGITFKEKPENYIYYMKDLKEYIEIDASSDINIEEIFTIYCVPNLNTADIKKLELFLQSQNYNDGFIENFCGKIKSIRGTVKNYLMYPLNKSGLKEGLMVKKSEYEGFKDLKWNEDEALFKYFDYKGGINLNFVNEDVFQVIFNACSDEKNVDYKEYWEKINEMQKQNTAIKESDYDKIFGFRYIKVGNNDVMIKRWLYYEKIFSVDSSIFKVEIKKNNKVLTAYLRRYKDKESKVKILKISTGKYEEQEKK